MGCWGLFFGPEAEESLSVPHLFSLGEGQLPTWSSPACSILGFQVPSQLQNLHVQRKGSHSEPGACPGGPRDLRKVGVKGALNQDEHGFGGTEARVSSCQHKPLGRDEGAQEGSEGSPAPSSPSGWGRQAFPLLQTLTFLKCKTTLIVLFNDICPKLHFCHISIMASA